MLEIKNLSHGFGDHELYKNVNIRINKGDKIGLVGTNGSGKSSLINIINGNLISDKGDLIWDKKHNVGYLDQYAKINSNLTIYDYLEQAFDDIKKVEIEYNELNKKFETASPNEFEELLKKSTFLFEYLDKHDFYSIPSTIKKVASGLGVVDLGLDTKIQCLSGGQRAKVILSKLLLSKPDLIILDEPTNFLDTKHIEWLETYLKNFDGTFLIVSHDTHFLDAVCNTIWSVEYLTINKYSGNYTQFLKQKAEKETLTEKIIAKQEQKIQKLEDYIAKNSARSATAKQAQSRAKQLSKIERIEKPKTAPVPNYKFKHVPIKAKTLIDIKNLTVGYEHPLLKNINLIVDNHQKIRITGFNGLGKSTFLKTIMGMTPELEGIISKHHQLNIGYFAQDISWEKDSLTPIEELRFEFPKMDDKQIRACLAQAGLPSKLQMQPLKSLSGGEQTKVKLCKFILQPFNMLILDEPTNHLDTLAKDALAKAVNEFDGAVIFVSHMEDFANQINCKTLDLQKNLK